MVSHDFEGLTGYRQIDKINLTNILPQISSSGKLLHHIMLAKWFTILLSIIFHSFLYQLHLWRENFSRQTLCDLWHLVLCQVTVRFICIFQMYCFIIAHHSFDTSLFLFPVPLLSCYKYFLWWFVCRLKKRREE